MPGLYSRLQEIIGEKIFRHKVVFDGAVECKGDVVHKKHITAYAPVAGEPSCGTPHPAPKDGSNLRQIYTGTPATAASVTEVDVSAYVPVGTKAIYVFGGIKTGSNTYGYLAASKTNAANFDNAVWLVQGYGGAAFQYYPISGLIYLDASRKFWLFKSSAGITSCELYIGSYFV